MAGAHHSNVNGGKATKSLAVTSRATHPYGDAA